jgi:hypothetical protein
MKVKDLIKSLQKLPNQNAPILTAADDEGNVYNILKYTPSYPRYYLKEEEHYIQSMFDEDEMKNAIEDGSKKSDFVKCVTL